MNNEAPQAESPQKEIPRVNPEKLMGRVMSSKEYARRNDADREAMENRGETPSGKLERIAAEADERAQEKLAAHNTGLFNRIKNVASRTWDAVKGIGKFIKEDIVVPFSEVFTGKKNENAADVVELDNKLDDLHSAIANAEGNPELQDTLTKKYNALQAEREELVDPRGFARRAAENEKEKAKEELAEAQAFMKSEASRLGNEAAEKYVHDLDSAVAKAKEMHKLKLEQEADAKAARVNLGRAAATLLMKAAGENPETASISEKQALAIGAIIEGAKGTMHLPERARAGYESAKGSIKKGAKDVYEVTRDAAKGMVMADDIIEGTKGLGRAFSFIGAAIMNKPAQEEILAVLGAEEVQMVDAGDGVMQNEGTRTALARMLKNGAVNSFSAVGTAAKDLWSAARDSETAQTVKSGGRKAAKGLGYVALGASVIAAAPILIPGAGIYYGAKAAKRGYEIGSSKADKALVKMAPALATVLAPTIEVTAAIIDAPMNTKKEIRKLGQEANDILLSTAETINENTRNATAAYNTFTTRLEAVKSAAVRIFNTLEAEAISEAKRRELPELSENVGAAAELLAQVDEAARAEQRAA